LKSTAVYIPGMRLRTLNTFLLLALLGSACSGKSSVLTAGYERFGGKSPSPNAERALVKRR